MSKKNIESTLLEQRSFPPPRGFAARARLKPADIDALNRRAAADHVGYWSELARAEIQWNRMFTVGLDDSQAPNYRWFTDGELNVSYNCLDVHLARARRTRPRSSSKASRATRAASPIASCTRDVCRLANALKAQGITPRRPRRHLHADGARGGRSRCRPARASARSTRWCSAASRRMSLKDRIEDAGARVADHRRRRLARRQGGRAEGRGRQGAVDGLPRASTSVIVLKRTGHDVPMKPGRDVWWHDARRRASRRAASRCGSTPSTRCSCSTRPARPASPRASSTPAPATCSAPSSPASGCSICSDDDVFWCTADVGWVTGHSYVAYGPLAAGATIVMYEGAPTLPDAGRFWSICEQPWRHHLLHRADGDPRADEARRRDPGALRPVEASACSARVGEPINPEAWMWYHQVIGRERCPIVDTWWQTETGAIMISPLPGVTATKPGSCTHAAARHRRRHRRRRGRCGHRARTRAATW